MGQRRLSGENQVEIFGLVFWDWAEGSSSMAVRYALLDGFPSSARARERGEILGCEILRHGGMAGSGAALSQGMVRGVQCVWTDGWIFQRARRQKQPQPNDSLAAEF